MTNSLDCHCAGMWWIQFRLWAKKNPTKFSDWIIHAFENTIINNTNRSNQPNPNTFPTTFKYPSFKLFQLLRGLHQKYSLELDSAPHRRYSMCSPPLSYFFGGGLSFFTTLLDDFFVKHIFLGTQRTRWLDFHPLRRMTMTSQGKGKPSRTGKSSKPSLKPIGSIWTEP